MRHALTILAVDDVRAARAFYGAWLERAPAVETPAYAEFLLADGQRLGLYDRSGFGRNTRAQAAPTPREGTTSTELYFFVASPAQELARVAGLGARPLDGAAVRAWGDDVAYAADPWGNVLALARSLAPTAEPFPSPADGRLSREDGRYRIRPYAPTDVDALFEAVRESLETVGAWMPWCSAAYARSDSEAWVRARPEAWRAGTDASFVIEDRSTGRFLGGVGLNRFDPPNGQANLGYWVRRTATGQGACTAATRLLRDLAFGVFSLHRLEVLMAVENHASRRIAEKLGARPEGHLADRIALHGRRHDALLYALTRDAASPGARGASDPPPAI